ncbi:MAG: SulP family inorganic anion transporter [Cephaloticoccus sp.]|nr:SulP family inorganic anion transporter [Cephaloticoccus sp.]MCF7760397.1 SulP family inorganic anion transporter [Cephaloticoccus sp.]
MKNPFVKKRGNLKDDVLSGMTVALALVPEAIAFAFVAGVPPLTGMYAAFIVCLITSVFGGRPGMISAAAGSLAVVMVALVMEGNVRGGPGAELEYLLATVVLMGAIQLIIGWMRLGRFIRLVPHPVMMGFVNGLAVVIFLAQFGMFKERRGAVVGDWLQGPALWTMLGLVALTMLIIHYLPKLTKVIPSSLAAILIITGVVMAGVNTQTVGDLSSVAGGFPLPHLPRVPFTWDTLNFIFPYAVILAAVGLIESLMTVQLVDELTETRGRGNREAVVLGFANMVAGFFKGMGGCALIGQTLINIRSGGRGRTSGFTAAICLILFILVGAPLIDRIPIAALTGVMFIVVISTFEWATFNTVGKAPKSDILVIAIVTGVTVVFDLAIAVLVGVVVSALVFAWKSAKHVQINRTKDEPNERHYTLEGLLYFGSVREFSERFDPAGDPENVVVDFRESRVCDLSGLEALNVLAERYRKLGKTLHLRHLSPDCRAMLRQAGTLVDIEVMADDPHYTVARV